MHTALQRRAAAVWLTDAMKCVCIAAIAQLPYMIGAAARACCSHPSDGPADPAGGGTLSAGTRKTRPLLWCLLPAAAAIFGPSHCPCQVTLLVQMTTVLSAPPEANRLPLAAYATAYTASCGHRKWCMWVRDPSICY
jgi:hypothetical protein